MFWFFRWSSWSIWSLREYFPKIQPNQWYLGAGTLKYMHYFKIGLNSTWNSTKIFIFPEKMKTKYEQHNLFWQLSPMPTAKTLSGLVPVKGTLYAVGGILQNSYATRELVSYNIERDTWTMLPQMKEVRYDPGKQKKKNQHW